MKTTLVAMFGGLAMLASSLVPSLAMAHDRDDGDRWEQARERAQEARALEDEHARMHAENPYMTPWQHAALHRSLARQQRAFLIRERREDRRGWRWRGEEAWRDRDGRFDRDGRRDWDGDRR